MLKSTDDLFSFFFFFFFFFPSPLLHLLLHLFSRALLIFCHFPPPSPFSIFSVSPSSPFLHPLPVIILLSLLSFTLYPSSLLHLLSPSSSPITNLFLFIRELALLAPPLISMAYDTFTMPLNGLAWLAFAVRSSRSSQGKSRQAEGRQGRKREA